MPLIKTLARDMKPGDIITIGGVPVVVELVSSVERRHRRNIYTPNGPLVLDDDVLYEVERPDPDEALVEVMAQAIRSDDDASDGPSSGRAAIAAAREAGLL